MCISTLFECVGELATCTRRRRPAPPNAPKTIFNMCTSLCQKHDVGLLKALMTAENHTVHNNKNLMKKSIKSYFQYIDFHSLPICILIKLPWITYQIHSAYPVFIPRKMRPQIRVQSEEEESEHRVQTCSAPKSTRNSMFAVHIEILATSVRASTTFNKYTKHGSALTNKQASIQPTHFSPNSTVTPWRPANDPVMARRHGANHCPLSGCARRVCIIVRENPIICSRGRIRTPSAKCNHQPCRESKTAAPAHLSLSLSCSV